MKDVSDAAKITNDNTLGYWRIGSNSLQYTEGSNNGGLIPDNEAGAAQAGASHRYDCMVAGRLTHQHVPGERNEMRFGEYAYTSPSVGRKPRSLSRQMIPWKSCSDFRFRPPSMKDCIFAYPQMMSFPHHDPTGLSSRQLCEAYLMVDRPE